MTAQQSPCPTIPDEIPYGYCQCGCGEKTSIAKASSKKHGWVKGQPKKYIWHHHNSQRWSQPTLSSDLEPVLCQCGCGQQSGFYTHTNTKSGCIEGAAKRYIHGHNTKGKYGDTHPQYKINIKTIRCTSQGGKFQAVARFLVEQIIGYTLPINAAIHHADGNNQNNKLSNLVVCENAAYHMLLHRRTRALKACGHADWRKCRYCKQYDKPENLRIYVFKEGNHDAVWHKECLRNESKRRWKEKKESK
jgi:hypothetical protein